MALSHNISRRSLTQYAAKQIIAGNSNDVLSQIAAYLIETGKTKDYPLVISDIERQFAELGSVLVRVKSARPISKKSTNKIKEFMLNKTGANNIEVLSEIDESVIGGAIISTADYTLDISLQNRLNKLKGINKE